MKKSSSGLLHGDLTKKIIGVFFDAHRDFGHGFLEKLCQRVMVIALRDAGLDVAEEIPFEVFFRGHKVGHLITDIVVNELVLLEVKSGGAIEPRHRAQVMNSLRASRLEVGLILNFGPKAEFDA